MVDRKLIINKLNELNKYLTQLRKYKGVSREELENDLDKLWAVERGLQLSIQIILDIGNHILSEKGIVVENYMDIFKELVKLEVIPEDFGNQIKGMAGFRNILVHEYAEVDIDIIIKVLNNSLNDFGKYAEYINNYIE
ncbi:MAG: type VII toxin-antitoxin system HepT family RNase toxin [Halanaerobium sp.]